MKIPIRVGKCFFSVASRIGIALAICCAPFSSTRQVPESVPQGNPAAAFASQPAETGERAAAGSEAPEKQSLWEISYGGKKLVIFSDARERAGGHLQRAKGNVTLTFLDMVLTCEEVEYDEETLRVTTFNPTRFRSRRVSLISSGATFDPVAQTVTLKDASGYFYETSGKSDREYFLTGGMSRSIQAETLDIRWGSESRD
jgi:hypothetical protein